MNGSIIVLLWLSLVFFLCQISAFLLFSIRTEKMLIFSFYTVFKKYSCLKITCCGLSYASCGNEFAFNNKSQMKNDYLDCLQNWKVNYQKLNKINFLVVLGTSFFLLSLIRRNYWVEINLKSIYNLMISIIRVFLTLSKLDTWTKSENKSLLLGQL